MVTETFELRPTGAPAFKFGKAPAPARAGNYDDWNELESQYFLKKNIRNQVEIFLEMERMSQIS